MTVNRRVDDRVVKVQAGFLNAGVPVAGVLFELAVEGRVRAQRAAEGGFVIRGAAHPAVAQARPLGDRIALLAQVIGAFRHAEEFMGIAAAAGIGVPAQESCISGLCSASYSWPTEAAALRKAGCVVTSLTRSP